MVRLFDYCFVVKPCNILFIVIVIVYCCLLLLFIVVYCYCLLLFIVIVYCLLRTGDEELLMSILTPLNVNGHACDGRKVRINI